MSSYLLILFCNGVIRYIEKQNWEISHFSNTFFFYSLTVIIYFLIISMLYFVNNLEFLSLKPIIYRCSIICRAMFHLPLEYSSHCDCWIFPTFSSRNILSKECNDAPMSIVLWTIFRTFNNRHLLAFNSRSRSLGHVQTKARISSE